MLNIRSRLKRLLHPFDSIDIIPGTGYSALDDVVQQVSHERVEWAFSESDAVQRLAAAHTRFFDDDDAELALKKALHVSFEQCLRVLALWHSPSELEIAGLPDLSRYGHPLDGSAREVLMDVAGAEPPPISALSGRRLDRLRVSTVLRSLMFLFEAVWILVRHGRPRVPVASYQVGSPGLGAGNTWRAVRKAVEEMTDGTEFSVLHVLEYPGSGLHADCAEFFHVNPNALKVPVGQWLRSVVGPGFRLVFSVLGGLMGSRGDAWTSVAAYHCVTQARLSLRLRRIAANFRFGAYVDFEEHSDTHIVKAIVLGKTGAKLVRWPHAVMDTPGACLSYLGYDYFLAGGTYESDNYGANWSPRCRGIVTGMVKNDRRLAETAVVDEALLSRAQRARADGRRIVGWFLPSPVPELVATIPRILDVVAERFLADDRWLVIVKAKSRGCYEALAPAILGHPDYGAWLADGQIAVPPYDAVGREPCPVGWLVKAMTGGIGVGSVQIEALVQSKPVFSLWPWYTDTALNGKLAEHGLLHRSPDSLSAALEAWRTGGDEAAVPYDWFRERFDPFGDDDALARVARLLWADGGIDSAASVQSVAATVGGPDSLLDGSRSA